MGDSPKRPSEPLEPLLNTKDVARILGVHPNTLWKWRNRGYGPVPVEIGPDRDDRTYRYRRQDVVRFIEQSTKPHPKLVS